MDQRLYNYINYCIRQGYTKEQIRNYLVSQGWDRREVDSCLGSPRPDTAGKEFDFWSKLKYLFTKPDLFFEKIKSEAGIKNALLMYSIVLVFVTAISYVLFRLGSSIIEVSAEEFYTSLFGEQDAMFYLILQSLVFPLRESIGIITGVIGIFIYSRIIHALSQAFKGEGTYTDTFKVCTYSMIPSTILMIFPLVGYLSIIYSIVLMIKGISKFHNISKGKATIVCLIPLVFALLLAVIGFFAIAGILNSIS